MKKYIIGTIFGFVLATAVGANAQGVTNLIDQVVQGVFPVTVQGASIGEAVVIDNKTYLPVREFGEAVGYTVTFTEAREVVLTKNIDPTSPIPAEPVATPQPTAPLKPVSEQIDDLKKEIGSLKSSLESNKLFLEKNEKILKEPGVNKESFQKVIDGYNAIIKDIETKIADYEAQITALEAQK